MVDGEIQFGQLYNTVDHVNLAIQEFDKLDDKHTKLIISKNHLMRLIYKNLKEYNECRLVAMKRKNLLDDEA